MHDPGSKFYPRSGICIIFHFWLLIFNFSSEAWASAENQLRTRGCYLDREILVMKNMNQQAFYLSNQAIKKNLSAIDLTTSKQRNIS